MYADGYKYWLAHSYETISYYRCCRNISSKCPGRCVSQSGKIRITTEHTHPAEPDRALVDKFRKVLTHRASVEEMDLFTIYCDEAAQRHSDAAMLYPFSSAESAMRKARRKRLPQAPNTINDIVGILDHSELFRVNSGSNKDPIYQKTITLEDSTCMIFMHRKTYELFGQIDEIHLDSSVHFTCQVTPNYHLLTIHAVQSGITAPIVYALVTSKTQSVYAALFAYLREDLYILPNIIMSNFDQLMQTSLAYTFPEAIIKGCWFHYTDAVLYQMKSLDMQRETAKGVGANALRMLLALPLLPAEYMTPGLEALRKWMKEKNIFSKSLSNLCDYIEQAWLRGVGAEKISMFGTPNFSTHIQDFNKELLNAIGVQTPIIWTILESLTQIATKTYVKINKRMKAMKSLNSTSCSLANKNNGIAKLGRSQRKNEILVDKIISSATQLWIKTPVHLRNPLQFLQLSSHCIDDKIYSPNINDIKSKNNNSFSSGFTEWQSQQYQNFLQRKKSQQLSSSSSSTSFPMHYGQQNQQILQCNYNHLNNSSNNLACIPIQNQHQQLNNNNNCNTNNNSNNSGQHHQPNQQPSNSLLNDCLFSNSQSSTRNNLQGRPLSSDPPPLVFFPSVKRLALKRKLPLLSDPPPLVPISFNKK